MITFHGSSATVAPLTCQVQVVGTFAADMSFADVVLGQVLDIITSRFRVVKMFSCGENLALGRPDRTRKLTFHCATYSKQLCDDQEKDTIDSENKKAE